MIRRSIDEQIEILEDERDRLEKQLADNSAYQKIKAHGMFGSETTFVDYRAIVERLERIKQQLTTLYNSRY